MATTENANTCFSNGGFLKDDFTFVIKLVQIIEQDRKRHLPDLSVHSPFYISCNPRALIYSKEFLAFVIFLRHYETAELSKPPSGSSTTALILSGQTLAATVRAQQNFYICCFIKSIL